MRAWLKQWMIYGCYGLDPILSMDQDDICSLNVKKCHLFGMQDSEWTKRLSLWNIKSFYETSLIACRLIKLRGCIRICIYVSEWWVVQLAANVSISILFSTMSWWITDILRSPPTSNSGMMSWIISNTAAYLP